MIERTRTAAVLVPSARTKARDDSTGFARRGKFVRARQTLLVFFASVNPCSATKSRRSVASLVLAVATLGGCAADPWKQSYTGPGRTDGPSYPPSTNVQVRVITFAQLNEAQSFATRYLDEHKLAKEDVTPIERRELWQGTLGAFRMREDARNVNFLGQSAFTSEFQAQPDDPRLIEFAKSLGADVAFLATEYEGERQGYTTVPMTTSTNANRYSTITGPRGTAIYQTGGSSTSTAWVPIPTTYQQWSNVAIYMRRLTPEERTALESAPRSTDGAPK